MSKLKLTLACWDYDRTRPLIDGRVQAEGIDLEIKVLRPRETFPRMLEYIRVPRLFGAIASVSEQILEHSLCIRERKEMRPTAIPAFPETAPASIALPVSLETRGVAVHASFQT